MKRLIAVLAAALLSGCANILYRTDGMDKNRGPYYCTCGIAECVAAPFTGPKGPEGGIAKAWCTLLLPFTVIDLPLEAVVDTVLFPYDFFAEDNNQRKETEQ